MKRKKTAVLVVIIAAVAIAYLFSYLFDLPEMPQANEKKFITKVIDGDTVVSEGESIRLIGIDSDERGYPCYSEAKKRMEELALNKEAVFEKGSKDKDQYGRLLRYIFINGTNINLKMVEEGLAVAMFYPENKKYKEEIVAAEKRARESGIGCKWKK